MQINKYKVLPIDMKAEALWYHGKLVERRRESPDSTVSIFHLFGFFVLIEVSDRDNRVLSVTAAAENKFSPEQAVMISEQL
jgi:hypothetical protein